jgi:SAM-dependent methyltransferase
MNDANSAHFWEGMYQSNQFPWDLGGPTPVFQRLAHQAKFEPGRMLVLGAGRGHDARLFARHGFEVTAVDFASEAIEAMQRLNDPGYPVEVVQADFFALPLSWNNRFNYLLDYTCFCAIVPERRPEYARLVGRLLRPGGCYVILAFPIGRRAGGPPYVVQPQAIIDLFVGHGFTLHFREVPFDSVQQRKGHEELLMLERLNGRPDDA